MRHVQAFSDQGKDVRTVVSTLGKSFRCHRVPRLVNRAPSAGIRGMPRDLHSVPLRGCRGNTVLSRCFLEQSAGQVYEDLLQARSGCRRGIVREANSCSAAFANDLEDMMP